MTWVFSTILHLGFGLKVSDTHGMKVLRRDDVVALVQRSRFGTDLFDTELVIRAERAGMRVDELPVVVEETRPSRTSIARRIPRSIVGLARLRLVLWRRAARSPTALGAADGGEGGDAPARTSRRRPRRARAMRTIAVWTPASASSRKRPMCSSTVPTTALTCTDSRAARR